MALLVLVFAAIFALPVASTGDRGMFYLVVAAIAAWTIAGPFLYALLTRSTHAVVLGVVLAQ